MTPPKSTSRRVASKLGGSTARAGTNLVELMVAIAMLAALMSFGIVLTGLLLRSDTAGHEAIAAQMTLERLTRQFRADAHIARSAAVEAESPGTLQLQLDANTNAAWTVAGPVIERELLRENTVAARDTFRFAAGEATLHFDEAAGCVELRRRQPFAPMDDTAAVQEAPQLETRIVAAIGIGNAVAIGQDSSASAGDAN